MNESAVDSDSWLQQLNDMVEVSKVIDKHADDIGEETEETSVQDVVEMLHSRVLDSLNGKWLDLADARILGCQEYRLTWAALRKEDRIIEVNARVVNSQDCNVIAKAFLEVVVREQLPQSKILGLSLDEQ